MDRIDFQLRFAAWAFIALYVVGIVVTMVLGLWFLAGCLVTAALIGAAIIGAIEVVLSVGGWLWDRRQKRAHTPYHVRTTTPDAGSDEP